MNKLMFSVFDSKARVYCTPFASITQATAVRDFSHAAQDQKSDIGRYPQDFSLWYLGEFDDQSGRLNIIEPEYIVSAMETLIVQE